MSTLSHPAPMAPRRRFFAKPVRTRRQEKVVPAATETTPDPYTRSALPLALSWFGIPGLLLVLSLKFHWPS